MPGPPQVVPSEGALTVFTDGASLPSPRRGGVGVHFVHCDHLGNETPFDLEEAGYVGATNNQMELQAVIVALRAVHTRCLPGHRLCSQTRQRQHCDGAIDGQQVALGASVLMAALLAPEALVGVGVYGVSRVGLSYLKLYGQRAVVTVLVATNNAAVRMPDLFTQEGRAAMRECWDAIVRSDKPKFVVKCGDVFIRVIARKKLPPNRRSGK